MTGTNVPVRRKHEPTSPIFIFQFLLRKVGDDTIIGIRHTGNNKYLFTLLSPTGERTRHEVTL